MRLHAYFILYGCVNLVKKVACAVHGNKFIWYETSWAVMAPGYLEKGLCQARFGTQVTLGNLTRTSPPLVESIALFTFGQVLEHSFYRRDPRGKLCSLVQNESILETKPSCCGGSGGHPVRQRSRDIDSSDGTIKFKTNEMP